MVLGALVIVIVGSLVIKYIRNAKGTVPQELLDQSNSVELVQKTHTVARGENLWNISVKYYGDGFKWTDIATENKLANASIIKEGQELTIPDLEQQEETEAISSTTYEVVKGDSLWSVAVRAYGDGYSWVKIARENQLINPNIIHPGNILVLSR